MKDTVLDRTAGKKIEINHLTRMFCTCQSGESLCNYRIYRSMMEMITSIFYIIIFAFVLYACWTLLLPPFLWS